MILGNFNHKSVFDSLKPISRSLCRYNAYEARQKHGFSLIELSIVLIIIGLLVAGVTGGASLIQSAKVRSMMNELKDYERAVYTFQAAKGRYPGDVKNYGAFGAWSNYHDSANSLKPYHEYKATDFPSEVLEDFKKTAGNDVPLTYYSGPFIELHGEGVIDFKPSKDEDTLGFQFLKTEPNVHVDFYHTGTYPDYLDMPCQKDDTDCNFLTGIAHEGQTKEALYGVYVNSSRTNGIDPKFFKAVDVKMDDGVFNTGMLRGGCFVKDNSSWGRGTYDQAIEDKNKCVRFIYML